MSGRGGEFKRDRRGHNKHGHDSKGKAKGPKDDVDETSPVIQLFRKCQSELDERHDRYERIVKLSRDITIESKRTIFQLHRISGSPDPEIVLQEAQEKIQEIRTTKWKMVAKELHNQDAYHFLRAYSPGLQEYIEAISFWFYLKEKALISLNTVENGLNFEVNKNEIDSKQYSTSLKKEQVQLAEDPKAERDACKNETASQPKDSTECEPARNISKMECDSTNSEQGASKTEVEKSTEMEISTLSPEVVSISVHVPPMEYILGLADLTGELMRMAINSVGSGNLDTPFELCSFMRVIHDAFVSFGNIQRELPRKLHTLKQSLKKVENACYALQVRGSEIPKHMLKDVFSSASGEVQGNFEEFAVE